MRVSRRDADQDTGRSCRSGCSELSEPTGTGVANVLAAWPSCCDGRLATCGTARQRRLPRLVLRDHREPQLHLHRLGERRGVAKAALHSGAHGAAMRLTKSGGIGDNAFGVTSIWKPEVSTASSAPLRPNPMTWPS